MTKELALTIMESQQGQNSILVTVFVHVTMQCTIH